MRRSIDFLDKLPAPIWAIVVVVTPFVGALFVLPPIIKIVDWWWSLWF